MKKKNPNLRNSVGVQVFVVNNILIKIIIFYVGNMCCWNCVGISHFFIIYLFLFYSAENNWRNDYPDEDEYDSSEQEKGEHISHQSGAHNWSQILSILTREDYFFTDFEY